MDEVVVFGRPAASSPHPAIKGHPLPLWERIRRRAPLSQSGRGAGGEGLPSAEKSDTIDPFILVDCFRQRMKGIDDDSSSLHFAPGAARGDILFDLRAAERKVRARPGSRH